MIMQHCLVKTAISKEAYDKNLQFVDVDCAVSELRETFFCVPQPKNATPHLLVSRRLCVRVI